MVVALTLLFASNLIVLHHIVLALDLSFPIENTSQARHSSYTLDFYRNVLSAINNSILLPVDSPSFVIHEYFDFHDALTTVYYPPQRLMKYAHRLEVLILRHLKSLIVL